MFTGVIIAGITDKLKMRNIKIKSTYEKNPTIRWSFSGPEGIMLQAYQRLVDCQYLHGLKTHATIAKQ